MMHRQRAMIGGLVVSAFVLGGCTDAIVGDWVFEKNSVSIDLHFEDDGTGEIKGKRSGDDDTVRGDADWEAFDGDYELRVDCKKITGDDFNEMCAVRKWDCTIRGQELQCDLHSEGELDFDRND
jgi:hypothetical protein